MFHRCRREIASLLAAICLSSPVLAGSDQHLTLADAERIALGADPGVARFRALADGLRERAVADAQLPDPKLKLGLMNFPTDTFNRTQEPMTQVQIGAVQAFPRGDSLALSGQRTRALSEAEQAQSENRRRTVLRQVRMSFLDVYLQLRSLAIVRDSHPFFTQLAEITRRHYAAGRHNQQDVIRAQLELSRLGDRETAVEAKYRVARAELAKWVGEGPSRQISTGRPPALPGLGEAGELESRLATHPLLEAEQARIDASRLKVELAREAYKPAWALDVTYGLRGGQNPNGDNRPDFLSAMVMVDLPIFRNKRQDRRLAASQQDASAALLSRDDRYRELLQMLQEKRARWELLGERMSLYESALLPQARQNTQASLKAYQSDATDFTTLMRAQIMELEVQLDALRIRVDQAKTQAGILYLVGEPR